MCTFVPELKDQAKLKHSLGISFKITCCGEASSQFHNPLQDREPSDTRATLEGRNTPSVARTLLKMIIK